MSLIDELPVVTAGAVYIHSAPAALCPHIEWALSATLGVAANLKWGTQPASPGMLRASVDWVGPIGSGRKFALALRNWPMIRFEITEDASDGLDGERFCQVPGLGFWHGTMAASGEVVISELRIRSLMQECTNYSELCAALGDELGQAWDVALEPYRYGGEGGGNYLDASQCRLTGSQRWHWGSIISRLYYRLAVLCN